MRLFFCSLQEETFEDNSQSSINYIAKMSKSLGTGWHLESQCLLQQMTEEKNGPPEAMGQIGRGLLDLRKGVQQREPCSLGSETEFLLLCWQPPHIYRCLQLKAFLGCPVVPVKPFLLPVPRVATETGEITHVLISLKAN